MTLEKKLLKLEEIFEESTFIKTGKGNYMDEDKAEEELLELKASIIALLEK